MGVNMPQITHDRIGEYVKTALKVVADHGGEIRSGEVIQEVGIRLNLDEYELARYEKSGQERWVTVLHFQSMGAVKAGWLTKNGGVWRITQEGESALNLSSIEIFNEIREKYRAWKQTQQPASPPDDPRGPQWDEFAKWGRMFFEWEFFDEKERNYKLEIADNLKEGAGNHLPAHQRGHGRSSRAWPMERGSAPGLRPGSGAAWLPDS